MFDLLAVPLILQLLIPLGLLGWLAFVRNRSRVGSLLRLVAVTTYLVATAVAGLWLILPWHLLLVYSGLLLLALIHSLRRLRAVPLWSLDRRTRIGVGLQGVLALLSTALMLHALTGRAPQGGVTVELRFPLRGSTYYVANGGSNELLNAHLLTLSGERFRPYRGQSYGVDLVGLNSWGFRARGLLPRDPAAYSIFGDSVYAPCAGRVLEAVDGLADLPPPEADREHLAGNHVLLDCGDAWILLGHLQQGSVRVQQGDSVDVGEHLGRVGNSGNTGEPHLHIHAQRAGTNEAPLGGEPLPMRFEGRYLSRNDRIRLPP